MRCDVDGYHVGYEHCGAGPMDDEVAIVVGPRDADGAPRPPYTRYVLAAPDGEAQLEWGNFVVEPADAGRVRVAAIVADYAAAPPRVKARCDAYIDLATGAVAEGAVPAEGQVRLVRLPQQD